MKTFRPLIIGLFVLALLLGPCATITTHAQGVSGQDDCYQYLGRVVTNYKTVPGGQFYKMYDSQNKLWIYFPSYTWKGGMWAVAPTEVQCPIGFKMPVNPTTKGTKSVLMGFVVTQK